MMIKYSCIFAMLSLTVTLSSGQPIPDEYKKDKDKNDGSFFNLPFLQFGNGGVKVNFAGYHAEAGLGGLLGGDSSKGGLYAGAGTPFGAHASADLGGNLGGDKGGGGLGARAGLGNGGPEAAAGLGGNLDGSNRAANAGTLYAGSSNGARTKIVTKNVGYDQTNIQVIPKKSFGSEEGEMMRRDINFQDEKINAVEPVPVSVVTEVPFHSVYPTRRCRRKRLCNNFVQKTLIYQQLPGNQITPDFGIPKPVPDFHFSLPAKTEIDPRAFADIDVSGGIGGVSADATGYGDVAVAPGPAPSPPSTSTSSSSAPVPAPAPTHPPAHVPAHSHYPPPYQHPYPHPVPLRAPTLFDHIFNIPISTLAAVNQLLNSKVG